MALRFEAFNRTQSSGILVYQLKVGHLGSVQNPGVRSEPSSNFCIPSLRIKDDPPGSQLQLKVSAKLGYWVTRLSSW